jgi:hypothetical protein
MFPLPHPCRGGRTASNREMFEGGDQGKRPKMGPGSVGEASGLEVGLEHKKSPGTERVAGYREPVGKKTGKGVGQGQRRTEEERNR